VNAGDTAFDAIAIVIDDERLPTPCGACRQVLAEFSPEMRVILATTSGKRKVTTLGELLPDPFLPETCARSRNAVARPLAIRRRPGRARSALPR
jgi:cytidine deaminase